MSLYATFLVGAVVADTLIAAYTILRVRRTLAKLALFTLLLDYIVATASVAGTRLGALAPGWDATTLWALVLAHPLAALFLLITVHGETLFRRYPYVLLILGPVPAFAALPPQGGYDLGNLYASAPLSWYLVLCLALPLGETTAAWLRAVARKPELFLLLAGAIVLVLSGPVYAFELQAIGFLEGAGSSPGAPVAATLFVAALALANPLAMPAVRKGSGRDPNFTAGRVLLIDEARPKGSSHFVSLAAAAGRPVLEIARRREGKEPAVQERHAVSRMGPTGLPGSVVLATASEFLARHPGGLVYFRDLSYLLVLTGSRSAGDVILCLRRTVAGTGGAAVASLALLTPAERHEVSAIAKVEVLRLPDPAVEFRAILSESLAGTAAQLLESFATQEHRRVEDLSYEDLPSMQPFLRDALESLAHAPGDKTLSANWRGAADRVLRGLDAFGGMSLLETAKGPWPSDRKPAGGEPLVVTASEYWKGREPAEGLTAAAGARNLERVGEQVRTAFVQVLGRTGDHLFEMELKRLGKSPENLGAEDIPRLAEASEAAISALGSALDIAAGRADMEEKGRRLKSLLAGIAQGVGHGA